MGQAPLALDHAGDVLGVEHSVIRLRTPGGKLQQDFGGLSAKFATSGVALSPDGRTVTGQELWRISAFLARFTGDGAMLLLDGKNLTRRNARDGRVAWRQALQPPGTVTPVGLDVSPDGGLLVSRREPGP